VGYISNSVNAGFYSTCCGCQLCFINTANQCTVCRQFSCCGANSTLNFFSPMLWPQQPTVELMRLWILAPLKLRPYGAIKNTFVVIITISCKSAVLQKIKQLLVPKIMEISWCVEVIAYHITWHFLRQYTICTSKILCFVISMVTKCLRNFST